MNGLSGLRRQVEAVLQDGVIEHRELVNLRSARQVVEKLNREVQDAKRLGPLKMLIRQGICQIKRRIHESHALQSAGCHAQIAIRKVYSLSQEFW